MDFSLTPEQELIRATAREFCDRELQPSAQAWDEAEELPRSLVAQLADAGFLAASLPEELGGGGLDSISYCLLCEELGRADSSVRGIVSVSNGLFGKTVAKWGSDEQRAAWLPRLGAGEALGCYALTEPGCGSDAAALATRAVREGDDWLLTGSKVFITLGSWADVAIVFARTGGDGPRGITAFLVPTDAPGFFAHPIKGKLGLRAQDTAELSLDGVRVPDAARLGEEGQGFKVAMSALDNGRISLAAGCVGIAQGCLDAAVAYAREREAFGRPVGGFQLVQQLLAEMHVETEAARLLTWKAAALADVGEEYTTEAAVAYAREREAFGRPVGGFQLVQQLLAEMYVETEAARLLTWKAAALAGAGDGYTTEAAVAKWYASETAVRAANAAVQVLGGYGYVDEYPVAKYLRDARVTTL
ncbi:MAG TPA: acyl-CoA dehydrogenase family protein, partial [Gaiellaceae bacterium]|nr:acyl-CoA dehydrogenase family protein [Gaiellaceae bacterium]